MKAKYLALTVIASLGLVACGGSDSEQSDAPMRNIVIGFKTKLNSSSKLMANEEHTLPNHTSQIWKSNYRFCANDTIHDRQCVEVVEIKDTASENTPVKFYNLTGDVALTAFAVDYCEQLDGNCSDGGFNKSIPLYSSASVGADETTANMEFFNKDYSLITVEKGVFVQQAPMLKKTIGVADFAAMHEQNDHYYAYVNQATSFELKITTPQGEEHIAQLDKDSLESNKQYNFYVGGDEGNLTVNFSIADINFSNGDDICLGEHCDDDNTPIPDPEPTPVDSSDMVTGFQGKFVRQSGAVDYVNPIVNGGIFVRAMSMPSNGIAIGDFSASIDFTATNITSSNSGYENFTSQQWTFSESGNNEIHCNKSLSVCRYEVAGHDIETNISFSSLASKYSSVSIERASFFIGLAKTDSLLKIDSFEVSAQ
ncbi:hypothetical protein JQC92_01230 [Shewanella sp. 202IG2-18]|uniref:hypothetical protein n=1 Tax=Parashewanella hymeniacidonis TaxID=2807618 RepID=UPI001960E005|nr:hypothetical protein [Parashewanella hymeniacidonis]MBM7070665.1 hypothetical protein [Parashewanella hymeniacidonis]